MMGLTGGNIMSAWLNASIPTGRLALNSADEITFCTEQEATDGGWVTLVTCEHVRERFPSQPSEAEADAYAEELNNAR